MSTQTTPIPKRKLYPIREARELLGGIGNSFFYDLVKAGKIHLTELGSRRFLTDIEIDRIAGTIPDATDAE